MSKGFKFVLECERTEGDSILFSTTASYPHDAVDAARARVNGIVRVLKIRKVDDTPRPLDVFSAAYTGLSVKTSRVL